MLGHAQSLTETWHQRCIFVKTGANAMRLIDFFPYLSLNYQIKYHGTHFANWPSGEYYWRASPCRIPTSRDASRASP